MPQQRSEGGEPSAPATPGLILPSYTTCWDSASELFTRGKKTTDKEEGQAKEAELFQQIGRLQMELEWLKKKSQLL